MLTRQVYSLKGLLCRSLHGAAQLLEVRHRLPVSFFFLFTWNVEFLQTFSFYICLSWINFDFWAKVFLLENAEFTKRLLLRKYTGVVNNPSSTKLSYSKLKNAVLNPSKSFLALKKVSPRLLSTFKKMGKTLSSHIIHSLGGEYCWIVRDSEPIRLLKSPRSLSVYIPISSIYCLMPVFVSHFTLYTIETN